jgi:hypothetical protein
MRERADGKSRSAKIGMQEKEGGRGKWKEKEE